MFLYPFRGLLPLASSYKVRAEDGGDDQWAATHGALAGLETWLRDNAAVVRLLDEPDLAPHVLPIAYEDYLGGDPVTTRAVLELVGREPDEHYLRAVASNAERYEKVQGKTLALEYREVDQLLPHVHDPAYRELLARAPSSVERDAHDDLATTMLRLRTRAEQAEDQLRRLRQRRSVRAALEVSEKVKPVRELVRRLRPGD